MRLIQQTPAWTLHAYIRFLGIEYTTENTFAFKALGLHLPLLVDNVHTKTEILAMNYLSKKYGNVPSEISPEVLFAAYLRQALVSPLMQLKQINKHLNKDIFRVMPLGLNFAFSAIEDIRDFICGDRFDPLPGATEAELIESITRVYSELNYSLLSKLASGTPPTFTQLPPEDAADEEAELSATEESIDRLAYGSSGGPGPLSPGSCKSPSQRAHRNASMYVGVGEAVMFGHMAEVLCTNEKLAAILVQFEGLLAFFQFICVNFFALPYDDAVKSGQDNCNWKSSLDAVLNNRFLDLECCERVKQCLLYGTAIPYMRLPGDNSLALVDSDPFAEDSIYPSHDDVSNDSNPLAHQHPGSSAAKSSPAKAAALKHASKDLFIVKDEPTALTRVGVDLSLSTDWRGAYYSVMGVFGVRRVPAAGGDAHSEVPLVVNTESSVHRVPLVGAAFLFGVTAAFGGYAYYSTRRKR